MNIWISSLIGIVTGCVLVSATYIIWWRIQDDYWVWNKEQR